MKLMEWEREEFSPGLIELIPPDLEEFPVKLELLESAMRVWSRILEVFREGFAILWL